MSKFFATRKRMPRYASLTWNNKKEKFQLRLGTPEVIHEWDLDQQHWAQVWARAISKAEHLPLRVIIPDFLEQAHLDGDLDSVKEEIPQLQLIPELQVEN